MMLTLIFLLGRAPTVFEQANVSALFSFGRAPGFDPSPDAVAANPAVQEHGAKVVKTVTVAVSMLQDLTSLVPVLKDLGAKHSKYGVVAAHYPVVGAAFLKTLSVGLGAAFTPEVTNAYTALWSVVQSTMLSGTESHMVSFIESSFTSKVEYEAWVKSQTQTA